MHKGKLVFAPPIIKQIYEAYESSDSQEPLSAVGNGEQSPCTPTEGHGFNFSDAIFQTPKLCPPTPTKTPASVAKPSSMKTITKSALFESESEDSDNENTFTIKSPISIRKKFDVHRSPLKSIPIPTPARLNNHFSHHGPLGREVPSTTKKPKRGFEIIAQHNSDDEELTPPGLNKKRPFDAITSPLSNNSNRPSTLLGGTPNFNFDLPNSDNKKVVPPPFKKTASSNKMDISYDFHSPMCPPSTIKPNTKTESNFSLNWFASPTTTKNDSTPIIETTPPSPVLFPSSKHSSSNFFESFSSAKKNARISKREETSPILFGPGCSDDDVFTRACLDSEDVDEDMVSDGEEDNHSMEDFGDTLQSQMEATTPPRATQSPNNLNVQQQPSRFLGEIVHENPFSPERNFKKTKSDDDFFSITDENNTSSYLQGKHGTSSKKKGYLSTTKKKRDSDISQATDLETSMEPIVEVYFSRFREDFEEIAILGSGCFGQVSKAKNRYDGMCYAVKSTKKRIKGKKDKEKILREVQALATQVDNPYLVRYYASWLEGANPEQCTLYIQTELCEGGNLANRIGKYHFTESQLIDMLRQLASGLMQMHGQNIVHLDLKPDNIYLTGNEDKPTFKIGDLGLAASSLETSLKEVTEGDSRYLAKELLSTEHVNIDLTKADMFSLGATIYECAIGKPLPNNGNEWHEIRKGNLSLAPHFSPTFKSLLLALMHFDPNQRPSSYNLLQHPIFTEQKLSESDLLITIQHQQAIIIKLKDQEEILRRKIEELERAQSR